MSENSGIFLDKMKILEEVLKNCRNLRKKNKKYSRIFLEISTVKKSSIIKHQKNHTSTHMASKKSYLSCHQKFSNTTQKTK